MNEVIYKWLQSVRVALITNYDKLGLRASGKWVKTLQPFNTRKNNKINLGILGQDYTFWLENGRRKNQDQTPEGLKAWVGWAGSTFLKQWVQDKQIDLNPYAVAWSIARKGWMVPNQNNAGGLVSDIFTKAKIQELNKDLLTAIISDFKSQVIKNVN